MKINQAAAALISLATIVFSDLSFTAQAQIITAPVEQKDYFGKCGWCLSANRTNIFCPSGAQINKCFDKQPQSGCVTPKTDMISTPCGTNDCSGAVPISIPSEKQRQDAATAASQTYVFAQEYTKSISAQGRCMVSFTCAAVDVEYCTLQLSNTAGNNLQVFMLNSVPLGTSPPNPTSESAIQTEINSLGRLTFRRETVSLLFVSRDWVNPQQISITYFNALLGVFFSKVTLALLASFYVLNSANLL